jgi:hypothetical protein
MLITYLLFVAPETHLRQMSSNVGGDDELNEWFDLFRLTQAQYKYSWYQIIYSMEFNSFKRVDDKTFYNYKLV